MKIKYEYIELVLLVLGKDWNNQQNIYYCWLKGEMKM